MSHDGSHEAIPLLGRGEVRISRRDGQIDIRGSDVIVSTFNRFAQDWFADALGEVIGPTRGHLGARRREIVFSVLCAESYIVEWTQEQLDRSLKIISDLGTDALEKTGKVRAANRASLVHDTLKGYFPKRSGLIKVWQEIPQKLNADGHISIPAGNMPPESYSDFARLIRMRNDLTHANISHMQVLSPYPHERWTPKTTVVNLHELHPGWAIRTVVDQVRALHAVVGRAPPTWLVIEAADQSSAGLSIICGQSMLSAELILTGADGCFWRG